MPPFVWIMIIMIGICVSPILYVVYSTRRDSEKENDELAPQVAILNQEIDSTYRLYFEDSNISRGKKLEEMRVALEKLRSKAEKKYIASHAITKTLNTASNLSRCGVSNTHFYTNLSVELDVIYVGIERQYEELVACAKKHNYKQIKKAVDTFKKAKTSGVQAIAHEIALADLLYFKVEGSVSHLSNVQGGGVNMQGAVAGAIIGGGAAAIIGSQLGTETKTEIVTKDDRKVTLYIKEKGNVQTKVIISKYIDTTIAALRELIPNKEESVVQIEARSNTMPVTATAISSADELKKYKELLDSGVISQEEFDAKKKQLLGL